MPAMQVTATQGGGTFNGILLRVKVLTGTAASPVGNSGSFTSFTTGPGAAPVTTTQAGSMVYGALMTVPNTALTALGTTTLIDQHNDTVNSNNYATFQSAAVTGTPGTASFGTSAPSSTGTYTCVAQEILSAGTIQDDPSAPAVANTDTGTTITTAAFTPPDGSLLLALVSSDGADATVTMTVAGGGVAWTELIHTVSLDGSYSGVWAAVAGTTEPDDPPITITQTGSTSQGITARIKVLTGAAPNAAQTGATATQSANAAHQASITTTQTGSIVYGAVIDGTNTSFTAAAGTTLFDNIADATNTIRYGTLRTTAATGSPGAVTAGASAPTSDVGSCALAEILPASPGGTINEDVSSPAVVTVLTSITCTVNVSPPASSLLVLMVASDGAAGICNMTVSGGGLNWRALAQGHATGQQYAGVWIADIPGADAGRVVHLPPDFLYELIEARQRWFDTTDQGGAAVIDSTGSSPAGAGAATAVATQIAPAAAAGAGSVTAKAVQIAGASAAGASAATAVATQIAGAGAAGAGAASDVVTQIAGASAAGAGSVTDVATQIVTAAAAGAGAVTAKAVQIAGAAAAGAGAVADVATQIAVASAAGAGSVTAAGAVSGASTASVAGAGSVTAVVTQIAPATAAGAGAVTTTVTQAATGSAAGAGAAGPAPVTQIAPAAAAGAGAVSDVATQIAVASAAGAGSVTAAGSVTGAGATASAAGAGAATAVATQIAPASSAAAGSVTDVATQIAKATAAGAGSVTAAGQITGTANVTGAGAAAAKAAQAAPAAAAGAAALSALATQRAIATLAAASTATALAQVTAPVQFGTATSGLAATPRASQGTASQPRATAGQAATTAAYVLAGTGTGTGAYPATYGDHYDSTPLTTPRAQDARQPAPRAQQGTYP